MGRVSQIWLILIGGQWYWMNATAGKTNIGNGCWRSNVVDGC